MPGVVLGRLNHVPITPLRQTGPINPTLVEVHMFARSFAGSTLRAVTSAALLTLPMTSAWSNPAAVDLADLVRFGPAVDCQRYGASTLTIGSGVTLPMQGQSWTLRCPQIVFERFDPRTKPHATEGLVATLAAAWAWFNTPHIATSDPVRIEADVVLGQGRISSTHLPVAMVSASEDVAVLGQQFADGRAFWVVGTR